MAKHKLIITGMTCEGCVAAVAEALRGVPGTKDIRVTREDSLAIVEGDATAEALAEAVKSAGYDASLQRDGTEQ